MYRIHIVGCSPRSGTTLLTEMMYNCFDIDLYSGKEDRIAVWPPGNGKIFLTKAPKDIIIIKDMLQAIKKLYVLYMLRDPRDVIVSRHPWDKEHYWSTLKAWKLYTPFGKELSGHPRFMTIRYEDLVSKPDEVQHNIKERLPFLVQKARFSNFHHISRPSSDFQSSLNGLRPVSSASVGNWRKHKARVLGQILKYGSISSDLILYGYETDRRWEDELKGVSPDLSEDHPSVFNSETFIRRKLRCNRLRSIRLQIGHSKAVVRIRTFFHRLKKTTRQ